MTLIELAKRVGLEPDRLLEVLLEEHPEIRVLVGNSVYTTHIARESAPAVEAMISAWSARVVEEALNPLLKGEVEDDAE